MSPSDWPTYEKLVLGKLNDLTDQVEKLDEKVTATRIDIATLKVKSGLWGAVAGVLPAAGVVAFVLVKGG